MKCIMRQWIKRINFIHTHLYTHPSIVCACGQFEVYRKRRRYWMNLNKTCTQMDNGLCEKHNVIKAKWLINKVTWRARSGTEGENRLLQALAIIYSDYNS